MTDSAWPMLGIWLLAVGPLALFLWVITPLVNETEADIRRLHERSKRGPW